jgi:hypothetical protein
VTSEGRPSLHPTPFAKDVVPFDEEDESPFVGLLQVEAEGTGRGRGRES